MAPLFIKDNATAALATKVAEQLGTTKTEAVRRGLRSLAADRKGGEAEARAGRFAGWLRACRAAHPLPDREAMKIDKAFHDSLSDEEEDFGASRR